MPGIFADVLAVVAGGVFGRVVGRHMLPDVTEKLTTTFGICAIGMGVSSVMLMQNMPAVILAIVLGTVLGLCVNLGIVIKNAGTIMEKTIQRAITGKYSPSADNQPLLATALVLFCASGTGIYGCLDAGITGNISILLCKSVLDFFAAAVFASQLGVVVSAIGLPQGIIFVLLYLLAKKIIPFTTPEMIADFKACGGFLLVAIGLNMTKVKEFPVAEMLPAMALVMPLSAAWIQFF